MSWIMEEAQRAHPARERVILENPTVVRELDTELGRCLIFMLFDDLGGAILRGSLTRSRSSFLFGREFFLGLPETTDPALLFRIMAEEDFAGMMPSLTIQQSPLHPEWDTYYCITLESGRGVSAGRWTLDQAAIGNIEQTIQSSIEQTLAVGGALYSAHGSSSMLRIHLPATAE